MATIHPDTFASLLGIGVNRIGSGTVEATVTVAPHHLNPHGTAHGALIYTVGGVAMAAAANDAEYSGLVSSVHVDYVHPARVGDQLVARAELAERTPREDLYVVRVVNTANHELVARISGRATRRHRRSAGPA